MKILIIEDEHLAARKLQKLVLEIDPTLQIVGMTDSIESSVEWLESNPQPDLILMDIELADGQSFEIFNRTKVKSTIIFTTAYDEYALKAFKVNSIDYLLKPVRQEELTKALDKFKTLKSSNAAAEGQINLENLLTELGLTQTGKSYRERFLVKQGQKFITIEATEIAFFYAEDRVNFLKTKAGQKFIIDYTLDELEGQLDPSLFFRLNRQFIAHVKSIESVHPFFNGKLKIHLKPTIEAEVLVSREKASDFKEWLGA
jgi:two-component system, LytTR family, response regulator LytT